MDKVFDPEARKARMAARSASEKQALRDESVAREAARLQQRAEAFARLEAMRRPAMEALRRSLLTKAHQAHSRRMREAQGITRSPQQEAEYLALSPAEQAMYWEAEDAGATHSDAMEAATTLGYTR